MSDFENIRDLRSRLGDELAYVQTYAPDFPPEDQTTVSAEFAKISDWMQEYIARTSTKEQRQWLLIAQEELEQALAAYLARDKRAIKFLQQACDHIQRRNSRASMKPRFFLGDGK